MLQCHVPNPTTRASFVASNGGPTPFNLALSTHQAVLIALRSCLARSSRVSLAIVSLHGMHMMLTTTIQLGKSATQSYSRSCVFRRNAQAPNSNLFSAGMGLPPDPELRDHGCRPPKFVLQSPPTHVAGTTCHRLRRNLIQGLSETAASQVIDRRV